MERWLSALSFAGGGVTLAVDPELTPSCVFCARSSAFSSPSSSASAPSSWWLFHFIVIPSTPSSASPLPSQDCPFTSSSSECQNKNALFASVGLWVSLGSSVGLANNVQHGFFCFVCLFCTASSNC